MKINKIYKFKWIFGFESKIYSFEKIFSKNSPKFQLLKKQCVVATKISLTGKTNLVVNYEDPFLIDCFFKAILISF